MKSIFYIIILLLCIAFSGCQKEPIDRNIEGMWRLEQFTTHEDGVVHKDCQRMFFSIQLWVVEVAEKQCTHGYGTFIGRFSYENDKQTVVMKDFVHRYSTGDDGIRVGIDKNEKGEIIYPISKLQPYGINSLETTFNVIKADGKHLILESDYATLEFTSF